MLFEIAIGDAYGAGFEYGDPEAIRTQNTLTHYVQHPRHGIKPGTYTDDTQMSIAVAEAMLSDHRWTKHLLAEKFVTAFQRDPRDAYARGFYGFLQTVRDGEDFLARIRPDSDKSGAAMRAAPVGLFPTVAEVVAKCQLQAALTHDTPDGTNAAVAAALLSHFCVYQIGPKAEAGAFIESHIAGQWSVPWEGKVGPKGWMSVRAAITAVARSDSLSSLLQTCIRFTGDVDTVAAIAMGAASCAADIEHDLPMALVAGLEDGAYGKNYVADLDHRLAEKFNLPQVARLTFESA